MRKIFLMMALLVISAAFLTGCAQEEAMAGEAQKICLGVSDAELSRLDQLQAASEEEMQAMMEEAVSEEDKALIGQAMGLGIDKKIMLARGGEGAACQWKCVETCPAGSIDFCCKWECN